MYFPVDVLIHRLFLPKPTKIENEYVIKLTSLWYGFQRSDLWLHELHNKSLATYLYLCDLKVIVVQCNADDTSKTCR